MELNSRRAGKSFAADLGKSYCRLLGGRLVSDTTKGGLRTETYKLPSGRLWQFVSLGREVSGEKS